MKYAIVTGEFIKEMACALDSYIWNFFFHKERGEDVAAAYCAGMSRAILRWLMEIDTACGHSVFDILIRHNRKLAEQVDKLFKDASYRPANDYQRIDV